MVDDDDAIELGGDAATELLLVHYRVPPDGPVPPDDVCLHADLAEMLVEKQIRAPTRGPGLGGAVDGGSEAEPTLAELDAAFAAEQAAPPLVELLAAYELRVAELASSANPPRSPGPGTSSAGPPVVGAD